MITTATAPSMSPNRRNDRSGWRDRTALALRVLELQDGFASTFEGSLFGASGKPVVRFVIGHPRYRIVDRRRRFLRRQTCTPREMTAAIPESRCHLEKSARSGSCVGAPRFQSTIPDTITFW